MRGVWDSFHIEEKHFLRLPWILGLDFATHIFIQHAVYKLKHLYPDPSYDQFCWRSTHILPASIIVEMAAGGKITLGYIEMNFFIITRQKCRNYVGRKKKLTPNVNGVIMLGIKANRTFVFQLHSFHFRTRGTERC